jgi:hypothetical protein
MVALEKQGKIGLTNFLYVSVISMAGQFCFCFRAKTSKGTIPDQSLMHPFIYKPFVIPKIKQGVNPILTLIITVAILL